MNSIKEAYCYQMLAFVTKVEEASKEKFQQLEITARNYVTLRLIYENPGITQIELAKMNHKDTNVISKLVDKFEKLKYVQRVRGEKDRRAYYLYMTEEGKKVVEDCWGVFTKGETERIQRLSEEEQQLFMEILKKIAE